MKHKPAADIHAIDEDRYHHGDLRHALITAAITLLTEKQEWSFSLREVARCAGVSHNAPYNHFESKQALLAAVAAAGYDTLRERMQETAAQTKSPSAALKAIGVAYVRFGVGNPAHYRLMFGTALTNDCRTAAENCLPSVVGESAAAAKGLLKEVIWQGAEDGSFAISPTDTEALDMAVLSAWSLVHGLTILLIDGLAVPRVPVEPFSTPDVERIAEHVIHLQLEGIGRKISSKKVGALPNQK